MGLRRVSFSAEPERVAGRGAEDRGGHVRLAPLAWSGRAELLKQRRHARNAVSFARATLVKKKKTRRKEEGNMKAE